MTRDFQGNNCGLLGTGANLSDHAHVTRQTPMAIKKKEIENDPVTKRNSRTALTRNANQLQLASAELETCVRSE
jgi:hypothetical protein